MDTASDEGTIPPVSTNSEAKAAARFRWLAYRGEMPAEAILIILA